MRTNIRQKSCFIGLASIRFAVILVLDHLFSTALLMEEAPCAIARLATAERMAVDLIALQFFCFSLPAIITTVLSPVPRYSTPTRIGRMLCYSSLLVD